MHSSRVRTMRRLTISGGFCLLRGGVCLLREVCPKALWKGRSLLWTEWQTRVKTLPCPILRMTGGTTDTLVLDFCDIKSYGFQIQCGPPDWHLGRGICDLSVIPFDSPMVQDLCKSSKGLPYCQKSSWLLFPIEAGMPDSYGACIPEYDYG